MRLAKPLCVAVVVAALFPRVSYAAPVLPTSYDMPNGYTGSWQYWDEIYSGAGCVICNGAALTGGLGDLTDGIIPTDNWIITEPPPGNGPYVGWTSIDPLITFHFAPLTTINSVTIYIDDNNGGGGVATPSGVVINGQLFNIVDPASSNPFSYTVSNLNITGDLQLQLNRSSEWVFMSEVVFNGEPSTAVPEPLSLTLLGSGLAGMIAARRRRARR